MLNLYKYTDFPSSKRQTPPLIIADTREKANKHILEGLKESKIKVINQGLSFGDYSFMVPKNDEFGISRDLYFNKQIVIERKNSLEELSGNIAQHRSQFENEFLRANKCKIILMVEGGSYEDILNQNYKTKLNSSSFFSSLMTFQSRYDLNIQFVNKKIAHKYIYSSFYYYFREYLKGA